MSLSRSGSRGASPVSSPASRVRLPPPPGPRAGPFSVSVLPCRIISPPPAPYASRARTGARLPSARPGPGRAGADPALRAILALGTTPSLADRLGAERLVREAAAEINRYRGPEAEVNALGYSLLNAGQQGPALQVFAINTRVFDKSANAWDSLGEALLAAGRREESIATYRRALAIDPEFGSAREALGRLGVALAH